MNPAFEKALEARLLWMQVRSYGSLGFHRQAGIFAQQAYWIVHNLAINQARCEPPCVAEYGAQCPTILSDVSRLVDVYKYAWFDELEIIEDELHEATQNLEWQREEAAERIRQAQLEQHAKSCIERNDWEALDLPTPEHLSAELYAGKPMRVGGHFLDYEDGIIWMDNPYGVEGCLGEDPTILLCRQFLTRIAKGGMYGPEP